MRTQRPYRFSIRAYPVAHRRLHGDELIETALALEGGRWSARQSLGFLVNGLLVSLTQPRRWWGLTVLVPLLYGGSHLGLLLTDGLPTQSLGAGGPLTTVAWVAKWLTVPSMPILLVLLAEKVTERPARWRAATAVWLVLGITLVLVVATRIEPITEAISNVASWRLWPTTMTEAGQRSLDASGGFGPRWTPAQILVWELAAVAALAVSAGLVVRHCARIGAAVLAGGAVPLAVLMVLFVYKLAAPWSFRADFDFFVGDVVLGSTLGDLLFFPAPFDPIGSMAIGLAALSMAGLIVAWGGVAERRPRQLSAVPVAPVAAPTRRPLPRVRSGS